MFFNKKNRRHFYKFYIIYFLIVLIFVILLILNLNVSPKSIAEIFYKKRLSSTKKILLWTSLYELRAWGWKETLQENDLKRWGCKVTNCFITSNKNYRDVLWYDAVMFHGVKVNMSNLPLRRSPKQLYIFFVQEFQMYYFFRLFSLPNSFFNWTRNFKLYLTLRATIKKIIISETHRFDSDIDVQFGDILDLHSNHKIAPSKTVRWMKHNASFFHEYIRGLAHQKTNGGAWFVSHCNALSMRDRVVKNLKQYVDIDIFGTCYNKSMTYVSIPLPCSPERNSMSIIRIRLRKVIECLVFNDFADEFE
jgi:hypothetical protein